MLGPDADLVIRHAAELCTLAPRSGDLLGVIPEGALACRDGLVAWTGPDAEFAANVSIGPSTEVVDATGCTVTPGLVDAHSHLVFAGDRAGEFAALCAGATYLDLTQAGGGIGSTVRATRAASEDELVELALPRLERLLAFGITTAEAKSGYGLSLFDEIKILKAVARLSKAQPVELVPTLLCAHAIPPEHADSREAYVELCVNEILPEVARAGLARFCDAFVDQGAFSVEEGRRILQAGRALGLAPRVHADQLTAMGASALAAELGAATADHLECAGPDAIGQLARAGVSAVLLPASTLFLRQTRFAPGRALWDAGVNVALGTNLNPGSAMSENAALTMSLACLANGLSTAEALCAFTRGAARALGVDGRVGSLEPGRQADVVVHACSSHAHLAYHLGIGHTRTVVKRGEVVFETAMLPCPA